MTTPRPSPNIWNHPETYEFENRAFDRGDYAGAAEGYQLYVKLGGADSTVVPRIKFCKEATANAPPK